MKNSVDNELLGREDEYLNETLYSLREKLNQIFIQRIISGVLFVMSLIIFVASIVVYINVTYGETVLFIILIALLTLLLSVITIIWSVFINNKRAFKLLGVLVFSLSIGLQVCYLVAFLANLLWKTFEIDAKKGSLSTQVKSDAFKSELGNHTYFINASFISFAILSLIVQILLSFTTFTSYICSNNKYSLRHFIHFINIFLMVFGFITLCLVSVSSSYYQKIRALPRDFNRSFLSVGGFGIGIATIGLSLGLIIINTVRKRNSYFMAGALLLFFSTLAMTHSGLLLRQSLKTRKVLLNSCPEQLRVTFGSDMEAQGCSSKYIKTSDSEYSTQCKSEEKSEVWEIDISKNLLEKARIIGCLNFRCCEISVNAKLISFFRLGISIFSLSIIAFVISAACLYLAFKSFLQPGSISYKLDYVFLTICSLVFIIGLVLFFSISNKITTERPLLLSYSEAETTIKRSNDFYLALNNDPLHYEDLNKKTCYSLYNLIEQKKLTHFLSETCPQGSICKRNAVRLGLTMQQGEFEIKQSYNDPKVRRFGKSHKDLFFPDAGRKDDFLAIEGPFNIVKNILSEELRYCPNKNAKRPKIELMYEFLFREPNPITQKSLQIKALNETASNQTKKYHSPHNHSKNTLYNTQKKEITATRSHRQEFDVQQRAIDLIFDWRDLDIIIVDQASGLKISSAWVKIYPYVQLCDKSIDSKSELMVGSTSFNGSFKAFNLIKKQYTIVAGSGGYKINCELVDLKVYKLKEFYLALTPEIPEANTLKAVLYWSEPKLNLQLLARFEHNQHEECRVGYFNPECGATSLDLKAVRNYSNFNFTQVVTIERLGKYVYAFSVVEEVDGSKPMQEKTILNMSKSLFNSTNAVVKIYVRENPYPVAEYFKPAMKEEELSKQGFHWMVFCLDGNVGFPIQKPIGIFLEDKVANVSLKFGGSECRKYLEAKMN